MLNLSCAGEAKYVSPAYSGKETPWSDYDFINIASDIEDFSVERYIDAVFGEKSVEYYPRRTKQLTTCFHEILQNIS